MPAAETLAAVPGKPVHAPVKTIDAHNVVQVAFLSFFVNI